MATKKNSGGDDTAAVDHSKSVDDHSEDVTVTVGSDTTTEVGDVTVEHWDHPKTHGTYRIDRGDRVIKYARPSSVDE